MLNSCFITKESENKQLNRLHLFIRARMDGILFMQERCHYLVIIYRKETRTHNTFIIRQIQRHATWHVRVIRHIHYRKPAICRVPRLCRVYFIGHSAKTVFAECQKNTLGKQKHTAKYVFAECYFLAHGKIRLCRVFFSGTRQRSFFPCAFFFALGKSVFRSNF